MKRAIAGWIVGLMLAASASLVAEDKKANELLASGLTKETIQGDLKAAIALYEQAVKEAGANRALAAKAQLRLAAAYQKQGDERARTVYEQVVRDYADLSEAAAEARSRLDTLRAVGPDPKVNSTGVTNGQQRQITLFDRQGKVLGTVGNPGPNGTMAMSPDGKRVALVRNGSILVFDVKTQVAIKLTSGPTDTQPTWSADGKRIAFECRSGSPSRPVGIYVTPSDGSGKEEYVSAVTNLILVGWSPDGRFLAYQQTGNTTGADLWVLPFAGDRKPIPILVTPAEEIGMRISPDGRFMAYRVTERGKMDVYVRRFDPSAGADPASNSERWKIATDSGVAKAGVRWRADGKELYYISLDGGVMAVEVATTPTFKAGTPRVLFQVPPAFQSAGGQHRSILGQQRRWSDLRPHGAALKTVFLIAIVLLFTREALPQVRTASVEGVVVKQGTNEGIAGASLELSFTPSPGQPTPNPAPQPYIATTDSDGKFIIRDVQAGDYRLAAAIVGGAFASTEYGRRGLRGRGSVVTLAAGQALKNARLEMSATSSISGRVVDRYAEPVPYARVMAFELIYQASGQRTQTLVQAVHTNDRGEYRLYWLPPGRYFVGVRPENLQIPSMSTMIAPPGRTGPHTEVLYSSPIIPRVLDNGDVVEETYRIVYYGGETDWQKVRPIDLPAGASINTAEINITAGTVPARRFSGQVIDATGQPLRGVRVTAVPRNQTATILAISGTSDEKGLFTIRGATPEAYYVYGTLNDGASAYVPVDAGENNLENISLALVATVAMPGRVAVEGRLPNGKDLDLTTLRVAINRAGDPFWPAQNARPGGNNAAVMAEGAFIVPGLGPVNWDHTVAVNGLPDGAYVKSIRNGPLDLRNNRLKIESQPTSQIEIVIGVGTGTVEGRAVNSRLEPEAGVTVVLIPDLPLRRRFDLYKTATSDGAGKFRLQGIPPGAYKLFAWEDIESNVWLDPELLRNDEGRGQVIRLDERSATNVDVFMIPMRK